MRIYNTKTLQIEEFKPIHEGHVDMYVCGPTVYNYAHIGNARPMVVFDVLKRLLEAEGYTVTYVSNFTDVDDKIINKAIEEGTTEAVIAKRYIDAYQKVRRSLNTELPDITPRVTETMDDIIAFIQELVNDGAAYVSTNGDVYFSVDADHKYGEISHQRLNELEAGARIDVNEGKRNPYDFALWKKTTKGIQWDSPWGKGRPGWHTECVVMINKNLGPLIDIHGGGMDLRFPHHENEAAQQECTHHNSLANYWIHNAMININGQKMSKSLGNTLWAQDVVDRLGTNLTRWLMSSVHYRKELNFSDETVETARKELDKVMNPMRSIDVKAALNGVTLECAWDEAAYRSFLDQLDDDLNTPNAYTVIFEQAKKLNQMLRVREPDWNQAALTRNAIEKMLNILGIVVEKPEVSDEDRALYARWNEARANKDFAAADECRKALAEKGLLS
ncbi:MAG: cysteine--tRNA ligase [Galactobacillus timonensis]|uniref:cysteine--tRNA ligase n=1 Tax=Galactobacillus timonensis TaxID=2041840 RepID=UPI0023F4934C|nr:cysteine--tRNA ligase [Galactobacillus timonensis]MCI6068004.1 cysteine--tRNA ligase [Galactobacillus timonensis]